MQTSIEDDAQAAAPTAAVRVGGALVMIAGLLSLLVGVQTLLSVRVFGALQALPPALALLGVALLAIGWQLTRARAWAAVASIALSALTGVAAVVWLLFSVSSGLLSCVAVLAPATALGGLVGAVVALGPARRATAARARLAEQGMDVGI